MPKTVSIIDIGSNSIKLLVANKTGPLKEDFRGARIGEGISNKNFTIPEHVIQRNITAILELLKAAEPYHPDLTLIVATSAVRDALNRDEFCQRVQQATGLPVKVLSGQEEALCIAQGVATDPNIKHLKEFCHFDIGGGSLECIHYKNNTVLLAQSLPLGVVRLTEQYIPNPALPIPQSQIDAITHLIAHSTPNFPIKNTPLIGSGGAFSEAKRLLNKNASLEINDLNTLLTQLSSIDINTRINTYHIPPFRADVMPTALAIIIALANKAEVTHITHSHYSLRFGLAAQALSL